ncbi:MAG: peptidase M17 [Myxococcus sp.]|nr:peptidase M17 [Myxococcus sp.]
MSLVKEPSLHAVDALEDIDAVVCLLPADQRPLQSGAGFVDWRLCGALSRALDSGFFTGSPGENLLTPSEGRLPAPMIFAVGLGSSGTVTPLGLEHALTASLSMLQKAKAEHVALAVPPLPQLDAVALGGVLARAFVSKWRAGRVVILGDPRLEASLSR